VSAAGHRTWELFARRLGVPTDFVMPLPLMVPAVILSANAVAFWPARGGRAGEPGAGAPGGMTAEGPRTSWPPNETTGWPSRAERVAAGHAWPGPVGANGSPRGGTPATGQAAPWQGGDRPDEAGGNRFPQERGRTP